MKKTISYGARNVTGVSRKIKVGVSSRKINLEIPFRKNPGIISGCQGRKSETGVFSSLGISISEIRADFFRLCRRGILKKANFRQGKKSRPGIGPENQSGVFLPGNKSGNFKGHFQGGFRGIYRGLYIGLIMSGYI